MLVDYAFFKFMDGSWLPTPATMAMGTTTSYNPANPFWFHQDHLSLMALSSKPWNRTLFIWTNFLTITHIEFCDILLLEQKLVLLVSTSTNLNPSSNL